MANTGTTCREGGRLLLLGAHTCTGEGVTRTVKATSGKPDTDAIIDTTHVHIAGLLAAKTHCPYCEQGRYCRPGAPACNITDVVS